MSQPYPLAAVLVVSVATVAVGALGLRRARRTSDFYVASRTVSPRWNAAAISGEYLSAASYLGIAGLILAYGVDMLWYPVGYTAGYLILLALVAAPLRRSGAYTLPDFAEIRLNSAAVRRLSSLLVGLIGWLYLVPQLQGASLTLATQTGAPRWLGGLVVCLVVLASVFFGGMRSITFAQAFQFWLKLTALLIPAIVLAAVWHSTGNSTQPGYPRASKPITVTLSAATTIREPVAGQLGVDGELDGRQVTGRQQLAAGEHRLGSATVLNLAVGDPVPVLNSLPAISNRDWARPLGSGREHPLYANLSLILAICLGTMGLPHVLVRFYTNPDGRDTRRTALIVIVLLSGFYLLPTVFGVLGRRYLPDLLLTGQTDATVLLLPQRMIAGSVGQLLGALVTAGAFAAFLSTASGLTVSVAGVLSQDLPRARLAPVRAFRLASVVGIVVPYLLSLLTRDLGLAAVVGLAFALAAATFCPLLVLGIWWPRLTWVGAFAGLATGGALASAAVLSTILGPTAHGWLGALLAQPAAWAVPVTFMVMIIGSLLSPGHRPVDVVRTMVRLHAPESLELDRGRYPASRDETEDQGRYPASPDEADGEAAMKGRSS
ncbi:MAG: cation acetate symporter [Actinomycetota bacterium]|nr:cation acetate symporter [Actinomycetota bacterium]MDQ2957833.1 cation acetate symporter [Actinomycetota bacterium]